MKKIILTLATLFLLNACSKDSADTTTVPETPVTPSTVLPKTITKDGTTFNYVYDGNKIKSYTDANKTQLYQYTYIGDLITKFSRIQNPIDLKGYEYNFTYQTNNFNFLSSYTYSFYTNTYSAVFTGSFFNNSFTVETLNKSNTTGILYPYDVNIFSPPVYTVNNNMEIIKALLLM
jgi:hypothetical protein